MIMTKLKFGIFSALVLAAVAGPLAVQHEANARLRDENLALRQQLDEQLQRATELMAENQRLSNLAAEAGNRPPLADEQSRELMRLRGEVGVLRAQLAEALVSRPNIGARGRSAQTNRTSQAYTEGQLELLLQQAETNLARAADLQRQGLVTGREYGEAKSDVLWLQSARAADLLGRGLITQQEHDEMVRKAESLMWGASDNVPQP
jgi:hypothetical protein